MSQSSYKQLSFFPEFEYNIDAENVFKRDDLELILEACKNKTLGELDRNNVFSKAINKPKITGIAGDVVEQSILGMRPNPKQEPDLVVDGITIELKTTGIRTDKKNTKEYDAKEPVSITAVSIDKIVKEDNFEKSLLWHKMQKILFVYYLYGSDKPVPALEYSRFRILSYQFYTPSDVDKARFKSDWTIVRDFLRKVQKDYTNPQEGYPLLSTEVNRQLVVLDTAPKYPNKPRFRIKRAYFTVILKNHFSQKLEALTDSYVSYKQLDDKLHEMSDLYVGMNVGNIAKTLGILNKEESINKQIAEQIIVRMFGGKSKKLSKVELFESFGVTGYSIALSAKDGRTEDTKMCPIDFDELMSCESFEESEFYHYYHDRTFLFFVVKETQIKSSAKGKETKVEYAKNEFLGFKRLNFSDDFIYDFVKPVWEKIRELISQNELRFVPDLDKNGNSIFNKTGERKGAPNFPKGSEGCIFVRGTSSDSTEKPLCINGIPMYRQNLWIRGDVIVKMLSKIEYI